MQSWQAALFAAMLVLAAGVHSRRLVAIGDLHGDVENAREVLRLAQVVDDDGHWATGKDTVIQMGDIVDRGPHGHTIMLMMEVLQREARNAGGELIILLGNHELMNWQGDVKFVAPQHISAFGGLSKWKEQWTNSEGAFGRIILERPTAVIRNGSVFVHAGITKAVAALGTVETLNTRMSELLHKREFTNALLLNDGPVWTREIIYSAQAGKCEPMYAALQELNNQERLAATAAGTKPRPIRRMVVGHTIQLNGAMRHFCNGTLYAIDIAISQYMMGGGHLGHLEIRAPTTPFGEETPWFWYPPKPATHHQLHLPVMFNEASMGAHAVGPLWHDSADFKPTSSTPFATRMQMLIGSKWHHRRFGSTDSDQALMLGLVGVSVILWRVTYNYRRHRERAAGKKSDVIV